MTYEEALNYIHSIPKFVRPLGNANLAILLEKLGNPQNDIDFIHIAGTNGKGSTAAMLSEILICAGYKTGMYTSPFIEVFNERIQINGQNIPDDELCTLTEIVKNAMQDDLVSEFAFITAMAFLYFKRNNCDYVVLETGMGGKLDATNIISSPKIAVLTSISLDHTQYLGDTIEKIAVEKCGIIKENCTVVSYPNTSVIHIIKAAAKEKNAVLIVADVPTVTPNGFIYKGKKYELALKGNYQPQNASVATEAARALNISETFISEGLKNVYWPARFEFISKNIVIDGGHNSDGIDALVKSLLSLDKKITAVTAMMSDKSCEECIKKIATVSETVITTELDIPRCESASTLASYCKGIPIHSPKKALQKAISLAGDDGIVCVCGSLYLAGEIKRIYKSA